jgi:hypothetical protein
LYLVSILRLQQQLKSLEASPSDIEMVRTQLERAGTPVEIRDDFLRLFSCLAVSILFYHFAQYKTGGL